MSATPRIVIAGGGVAGLEALLALRALLGARVEIDVVAPGDRFVLRQFSVAEPFGFGEHTSFDLGALIDDAGGRHLRDAITGVDCATRMITTAAGAQLSFDRLILAPGASPEPSLPGAMTYRGADSNPAVAAALLRVGRGEGAGVAFAVPATVHWSLPIYELALLGAGYLDHGRGAGGLALVTAEASPLPPFGAEVGARIRGLLERAGVRLHAGVAPARMGEHGLALVDGSVVPCETTIAMPRLRVAPIEGIPQDHHGFIDTDPRMQVYGCPDVYAAGDSTWFPVKQGGLATQQADVAAAAIAHSLDPGIESPPFRPVLRAALLTSGGPLYMRAGSEQPRRAAMSSEPLWWPPAKVAGRHLAPFIGAHAVESNAPDPELTDLEPASGEDASDHEAVIEMVRAGADVEASAGNYGMALRWLAVAERLELILPPEYATRREQWRQALRDQIA